jgi:hypothetical protein
MPYKTAQTYITHRDDRKPAQISKNDNQPRKINTQWSIATLAAFEEFDNENNNFWCEKSMGNGQTAYQVAVVTSRHTDHSLSTLHPPSCISSTIGIPKRQNNKSKA